MEPFLSWIFQNDRDLENTRRLMAFFSEKRILDELGVGPISQSLADQLFPGISTVMTRLRYMLFIPWIYQMVEGAKVRSEKFGAKIEELEKRLIKPLSSADDNAGVFGLVSGDELRKTPSSLYWNALGRWDIRRVNITRRGFHHRVDQLYQLRQEAEAAEKRSRARDDDPGPQAKERLVTWHPALPKAPDGFLDEADLALTYPEAEFLANRIKERFSGSLLALLALECPPGDCRQPWEHPQWRRFSGAHRELLTHARLLSEVMGGAKLAYFIQLADLKGNSDLVRECRDEFRDWREGLRLDDIRAWDLRRLWEVVCVRGVNVPGHTRKFLEAWVAMVRRRPDRLIHDPDCLELVKAREILLKRAKSRFNNSRALDQWAPNIQRHETEYRWSTVQGLLADLRKGLEEGGASC